MRESKMLSNVELSTFCEQMAMVLSAGISPLEGLMIMSDDATNKEGRNILDMMKASCEKGDTFHNAAVGCGVFPEYALNMIEIGEKSGKLDEVMASLAAYYNREEDISKGIKNAITYPFIIIAMMLCVIIVMVVKVMPIFNDVFVELGSNMTGTGRKLMDFGTALSKYSIPLIIVVILLAFLILLMTKTEPGRNLKDAICSKLVFTRGIYDKIASGRFAAGMSILMGAGLDIQESLDMIYKLVANKKMQTRIDCCKSEMKDGKSFAEALSLAGIFTNTYSHLVAVGYKTGGMDKVLDKIADNYEEEVDERIANIISVLEPTLVILLSVFICIILLSVMLPLLGIMTTIG